MKTNLLYTPKSIADSSRITHELEYAELFPSQYGQLACFCGVGIDKFDRLSENMAAYFSDFASNAVRDHYYHNDNHKVKSWFNRNIYISEYEQQKMETQCAIAGTLTQLGAESVMKTGARLLISRLNAKDKFCLFEQIYQYLMSYIQSAEPGADTARALYELGKIRNSFPLSEKEKRKLRQSVRIDCKIEDVQLSYLLAGENADIRNAVQYFLVVLHKQLYHDDEPGRSLLPVFYSQMDVTGTQARNLISEFKVDYDEIAKDEILYSQVSRKITRQIAVNIPSIDVEQIIRRNDESRRYDPYCSHRAAVKRSAIKVASGAAVGTAATLVGIYAERPDIVVRGVASAFSNFSKNDESIESLRSVVKNIGITDNQISQVLSCSDTIKTECEENDENTTNT